MPRVFPVLDSWGTFEEDQWIYYAVKLVDTMRQDAYLCRLAHDWYNILALPWLCVLNLVNWSFGYSEFTRVLYREARGSTLWRGEYFWPFFWATSVYFVVDVMWVFLFPTCVRSPGVILKHHISALLYMCLPYLYPEYAWAFGACMVVELNTWLMIARRMFSHIARVAVPLSGSVLIVKPISIFFYVTWVLIRVIVYPGFLLVMIEAHLERWESVGSPLNVVAMALPFQAVLVVLNFKWSYDLVQSKLRNAGQGVSKGL